MPYRAWWLSVLLIWVALTAAPAPPVAFIHPKTRVALVDLRGEATVPVQARVLRHAENRWFDIRWESEQGDHGQCCGKSIDGDRDRQLFPIEPVRIRLTAGAYTLHANVYGPGGRLRGTADLRLVVCGDESRP